MKPRVNQLIETRRVDSRNGAVSHARVVGSNSGTATFLLKPIPPFRLDSTVWVLRRRPSNLIDRWDGQTYRRVVVLDGQPVEAAVVQAGSSDSRRLEVTLTGQRITSDMRMAAVKLLERLLGLRISLSDFYGRAAMDAKLHPLAERFRGTKPPRFPTVFETLANAIACQQMSLSLGILLLSRMTEKFGLATDGTPEPAHAFPRPEDLAGLKPMDFRRLGFSRAKGESLIALAGACASGQIDLEALDGLSNEAVVERLLDLKGIGRWSAEYVLLRGLGRLNVYPGDDVGARNNLQRWLKLRKPLDYDGVGRVTARWQPHAGLVYFHMLLDRLDAAGLLTSKSQKTGGTSDLG
ncbi:MAG: DNA-3-methyladenine glycosylase 2 family protein [Verrucomicrobiota bacterium]|nr:DNA-3-methyladenine glycosylase 2 family protein [Verrucomicrobiota bacterium]